jgi:hypothetical protein
MILGLDISTSITGYTILDDKGEIYEIGHIDLRKQKNFFDKARTCRDAIAAIDKRSTSWIKKVYIEQSLQSFRSGFSSAHTLSLLSRFNGVLSWICSDLFDTDPEYIGATTARKVVGIKVPRGKKAKEIVLQFVIDNVPGFDVEYTRHGNPKAGYVDRSDSYVIAKAGWIREREEAKDTD